MKKLLIIAAVALAINAKSQNTVNIHVRKIYVTKTDTYATTKEGFILDRHWNGEQWSYWKRLRYDRKLFRLINTKGHREGWNHTYYFN